METPTSEMAEQGKQQLQSAKQEQQPQPDHPTSMSTQGHLVTAKRPNRPSF